MAINTNTGLIGLEKKQNKLNKNVISDSGLIGFEKKEKPIQQKTIITKTEPQKEIKKDSKQEVFTEKMINKIPKNLLGILSSDALLKGVKLPQIAEIEKILPSKFKEEKIRQEKRFLDSNTLGLTSNVDKKLGKDMSYMEGRSFKENPIGATLDTVSTFAGYIVPGAGYLKGAQLASKLPKVGKFVGNLLAKDIPKGTKNKLGKQIAQQAKEGLAIGSALSLSEIGIREAINPDDFTAKENAKKLLLDTSLGLVADPVAYLGLKGISKAVKKLPKKEQEILETKEVSPEEFEVNLKNVETNENLLNTKINEQDVEISEEETLKNIQKLIEEEIPTPKFTQNQEVIFTNKQGVETSKKILNIKTENGQTLYKLDGVVKYVPESQLKEVEKIDKVKDEKEISNFTDEKILKETNKILNKSKKNPNYTPNEKEINILNEYNVRKLSEKKPVEEKVQEVAPEIKLQEEPTPTKVKKEAEVAEEISIPEKIKVSEQIEPAPKKEVLEEKKEIKDFTDEEIIKETKKILTKSKRSATFVPNDTEFNVLNEYYSRKLDKRKEKGLTSKSPELKKQEELKKQKLLEIETEDINVSEYKKNDLILHNKFGQGTILNITPEKTGFKFTVKFEDETRDILTQFSNIKKVKTTKSEQIAKINERLEEIKPEIQKEIAEQFGGIVGFAPKKISFKLEELLIEYGSLMIRKGYLKFEDWSEQMVKRLGDKIRPYLKDIFPKAQEKSKVIMKEKEQILESDIRIQEAKERAQAQGQKRKASVPTTISKKISVSREVAEAVTSEYKELKNVPTLMEVEARLKEVGIDKAYVEVLQNPKPSAFNTIMAGRIIDELQKRANNLRATGKTDEALAENQKIVELVAKLRDELINAGQATQAMSLYNKLDANGLLLYTSKIIRNLTKRKNQTATLTAEDTKEIADIAYGMKRATGVEENGIRIQTILFDSQNRELTTSEMDEIARYVTDAREFVDETITGVNESVKGKRQENITDAVIPTGKNKKEVSDILNRQAESSRVRLSSKIEQEITTPLEVYTDYVLIGASKIADGTTKFKDWSRLMTNEFGDSIEPYLKDIFTLSKKVIRDTAKRINDPEVKRILSLVETLFNQNKISATDRVVFKELARKITELSGDVRQAAMDDLEILISSKVRPTVLSRVSSLQTIMQLLNPKTQIRNIIGNELFYRAERISKYIATPIDIARSKLTGTERTVTFQTNNQGQYWKNFMRGAKAGWRGTTLRPNLKTQFDLETNRLQDVFILKYLEKSLQAVMFGFDFAAYKRAYNETLGEIATLDAINKKIPKNNWDSHIRQYINTASDEVKDICDRYGRYATFQDDNFLSKNLQYTKKNILNFGLDFGIGDIIIKYPRTSGALITRTLEYSPAGIIRSLYHLSLAVSKSEKQVLPRKAILDLSRAFFGIGITAVGYLAFNSGMLRAEKETNYSLQELKRQAGQYSYQINTSALRRFVFSGFKESEAQLKKGDIYVSYDWAQPLALSLALSGYTDYITKEEAPEMNDIERIAKSAFNSLSGGFDVIKEQPIFTGLSNAFTMYPGQTVLHKAIDIVQSVPSSFTPTFLNQIRQYTDDTARETYDPNFWKKSANRALARIPYFSQKLPEKYDTLGNVKSSFQKGSKLTEANAFNVFFNPSFVTKYQPSPQAEYVLNLISKTEDKSLAPKLITKKDAQITFKKAFLRPEETITLTGKQYARLQELTGKNASNAIDKALSRYSFSENAKAKFLEKMLDKAYEDAKIQIKKEIKK